MANDAPSASEIDAKLQQLEKRIDTLKRRYERYFLGIDQKPPRNMRKQVFREVMELQNTYISNTAQRFQLRTLVQKFNTNKTRWNRILRQIEQGTYIRDRKRAERRKQKRRREREKQPQANKNDQGAIELNADDDFIEDLQEIDMEEVFNSPKEPQQPGHPNEPRRANEPRPSSASQPTSSPPRSSADRERIKKQRLAEIQRKLGLSGSDASPSNPSSSSTKKSSPSTPNRPQRPQKRQGPSKKHNKDRKPLTKRQKKLKKLQRNLNRKSSDKSAPSKRQPRRSSSKKRPRQNSSGRRVVRRSQSSPSKDD